jgi:DMSO/TMAO reductase YedYZ molybdopterin-dependent catalytic subunit
LQDGLIVRERQPENLEMPSAGLEQFLTPAERFYVRCHFSVPKLDVADWKLEVVGAVDRPLTLALSDVAALPARTAVMTLECAGNGRSFLQPKAKGVQWALGAVGNAEWTGVALSGVLERAGLKRNAVDVVLEGADQGEPKNEPKPVGTFPFARGLPLNKAMRPEVLLAYKMNGQPLTPRHGFPLRAIVGGWYGMASVKWLRRIVVTDRPFLGYDQTIDYAIWEKVNGVPGLVPLSEIEVKSSIARPVAGEIVRAGTNYRLRGAAWAGQARIEKVQISTDGGHSWASAPLLGDAVPFAWRLWEFNWLPSAGKQVLMVRASDDRGRTQPLQRDPDRRSYMINHVVATEVDVLG